MSIIASLRHLLGQIARLYFRHWPVAFGKWAVWIRLRPWLIQQAFKAGPHPIRHGARMWLDPAEPFDTFIYFWGLWEANETRIMERYIPWGGFVLDIGANTGVHTLLAASLAGPEGRVWAIEPTPATFEKLQKNIALNRLDHVEAHHCAAMDRHGTVKIAQLGDSALAVVNSVRLKDPEIYWEVEGRPVDEIIGTAPVDFVKIDVEGAEVACLRGITAILARPNAPLVLCEVTDSFLRELGSSADELYRLMRRHGYTHAYDVIGGYFGGVGLSPIDWAAVPNRFQSNVLFSKTPLRL